MADEQIPGQMRLFDLPGPPPNNPADAHPDNAQPNDAQPNDAQPNEAQPGDGHAYDGQPFSVFPDDVLTARLTTLVEHNQAKYQSLVSTGVMPDPRSVLQLRLEALLDLILTPSERLRFNVLFESRMAGFLDQCIVNRSRSELIVPVTQPAPPGRTGLIIPPH